MKLFTEEQLKQLIENGSNPDQDHPPVVKLFMPFTNCVWLLNEVLPNEQNIAFGLCDLGMGFPELGYVDLNEISEVKSPLGFHVQRDTQFEGKYPMSAYTSAARVCDRITEKEELLRKVYAISLVNKPKP